MPVNGALGPQRRRLLYKALLDGHHWSTACAMAEATETEVLQELQSDKTFYIQCRKKRALHLQELLEMMNKHSIQNEAQASNHLHKRYENLLEDVLLGDTGNVSRFKQIIAGSPDDSNDTTD